MRLYNYIFVFIFALIGVSLKAQVADANGSVSNNKGEAVPFALVLLEGTAKKTMTDAFGRFKLSKVKEGTYILKISSVGYLPYQTQVTVSNKAPLNLNIELVEKVNQLDAVTIEAEKTKKQKIKESGFAVNVIDVKEASLKNLQTNELLDRAVGVRVRQNGGLGASVEYNLNGMTGRSVGVFINGIEISTYGSSFNLNNIPPATIERIEVYKGVLPAHLAGDYLGGAINIVLKEDLNENTFSVATSYGSFNTSQTDISGMVRNKKNGLTLRASGFLSYSDNDYEVWGRFVRNTLPNGRMVNVRSKRFNDAYKTYGVRVELGYTNVDWADNFMISYNGSYAYNEIQHGQYMTKPYMGRFTRSNANVVGINYTKRNFLTKGLHLKVNGIYSDRDQYVQDTVSWNYNWYGEKMIGFHGKPLRTATGAQQGAPTMLSVNRKIATMRSSLSYDINKNHRFTFNHFYYDVDRNDVDEIRHVSEQKYRSKSDLAKNVSSLAYESQFFNNRLKTNLFIKHYRQQIDRISPYADAETGDYMEEKIKDSRGTNGYGVALSFDVVKNLMFLGSAEKAVRMPGEREIFGGPADNIVSNTELKPEMSNNLNLGLRLGFLNVKKHRFVLSGSFFTRNVRDKIVLRSEDRLVNENVQLMPYENLGLAQSVGFETEFNYVYNNKLNVLITASKFNSLFKMKTDPLTGQELSRYNTQIPNEPFFTINSSIQYRFNNLFKEKAALDLNYYFGYVHPFNTIWIYSERTMTPAQYVQDFGLSYRFANQKWVLSFDVKNLTNREVYDNFAVQKPGRAFYLKVNYRLNNFKLKR